MFRFLKIFLICLICIAPGYSESLSKLSFDRALQLGLENNPDLESERLGLNINRADILIAGARPNPQLLSDSGFAEDTYRLGLSYNFELGAKRKKRSLISESVLESAELGLDEKLLNFRQELRTAYSALFYAKEKMKLREELSKSFVDLYEITKRREELGDLAEVDVLQVKTEMFLNESQFKKSIDQVNQYHVYLEYLLNTDLEDNIVLEPPNDSMDLNSFTEDSLIDQALEERPELKLNEVLQKIASQELDLQETMRIPNLVLSAGPDLVTGGSGKTSAFVIAQIELPIFNRRKGEIESIKALQEKLNSQKYAKANQVKAEIKKDLFSYLSQKEVLSDYENKLVPSTKEYSQKRFKSFELGKAPIWVALDAQTKYINAQLEYFDLALKFQNSISSLERSIGVIIK